MNTKLKNSRVFFALLAGMNLLLMAGCQTSRVPLALNPVGPAPGTVADEKADGFLVVYSAFDAHVSEYNRQVHKDYKIYSNDEALLQKVHNDTGGMTGGVATVRLPAGSYRVEAPANGYGTVSVPVVIRGGKTTTVSLASGGSWPNRQEMIRLGAVQLPDGRVAGWSADAQKPSAP